METVKMKKTLYASLMTIFFVGILENISKSAISVAIIPITKDFNLDAGRMGIVLSCFYATYSIMSFYGGILSDKYGAKKVIGVSIIIAAVSSCYTSFVTSLATLFVARGILGLCQGVYPAASTLAIAELFEKEKRATGKSFLTSAGPLGSALSTIIVSALIIKFGWRSSFGILGAGLAGVGILFLLIYKPVQPQAIKGNKGKNKVPVTTILRIPLIWKLIVCNFGFGAFLWGMVPMLPTYFSKVKHLDMATVGALSSIPPLASFVFMIFSGFIIDKFFKGKERLFLCITSALGAIFVLLIFTASSVPLAFTYFAAANVVLGLPVPVVYVLVLKYLKNDVIGKASGVVAFAQQAAGFVTPIIMGYLINWSGGSYAPVFGFVIAGIGLVFVVAITINTDKDVPDELKAEVAESIAA